MDFREQIVDLISKKSKLNRVQVDSLVAVPPNPEMGDFAFPCFKLGGNPKEAAENLKQKIGKPVFLNKIEVLGPYLNFFLDSSILAKETISSIKKQKEKFGRGIKGKNVVIEYCGPNTNKPLHLGHTRNLSLGSAVCRILAFQGNHVHPVNIINDRGIHICKSMLAYKKWGKGKNPNKKGDHFVGDYYVLFAKNLKNKPELIDEAQELLFKWEEGDKETRALWKKMNSWVLKGFAETYKRFGVAFEKEYFESVFYEKGKDVVFEGLGKGVFKKNDEKAIVVELEKFGMSNKVLLRSDGTSVYMTQDLYVAQQRYQDFKFDKMIYVVGSEQRLHFKQLFKVLELLKRPFAGKLYHLSHGMVTLPSGKIKSREGTIVDADDLVDKIAALARKEVSKHYRKISKKEKDERAEFIALGALKFHLLKNDASRDMVYNPEESLSFEGETGPYVQYTHARACSILRKVEEKKGSVNYSLLDQPQEKAVLNLLAKFSEKVDLAAEQMKPHHVCRYLIDLSQAFNEFYHACKVQSDDNGLQRARLALVDATRQVLANGLCLLGIYAPEKM